MSSWIAACTDDEPPSGPIARDGGGSDGGVFDSGVPIDSGMNVVCVRDAGVEAPVSLHALQAYCQAASDGWYHGLANSALAEATSCGEPIVEADLLHLSTPAGLLGIVAHPACDRGDFATNIARFELSVAAGRMAYDQSKIAACQSAGRANDGGTGDPDGGALIPCDAILHGTVDVAGACAFNEECITSFCQPGTDPTSCSGVCAEPLAADELCIVRRDHCGGGATCEENAQHEYRCKAPAQELPPIPVNAPCSFGNGGCETGSTCVMMGTNQATCLPLAGEGEACGEPRDGRPPCNGRCLRCDNLIHQCVRLSSVDEPCSDHQSCLPTLFCAASGMCRLKPREGDACIKSSQYPNGNCLFDDNFCKSGRCERKPVLCEACGDRDDLSASCSEGQCNAQMICYAEADPNPPTKADGEACLADSQCINKLCDPVERVCKLPCESCEGGLTQFYSYLIFFGVMLTRASRRASRRSSR